MKKFLPGMRVIPHYFGKNYTGLNKGVVVLENKDGYVRRRWWGAIQFTKFFVQASKWDDIEQAVSWAKRHGLS